MKRFINIALAALVLLGTASCEDFLQKDPPSSPSQAIFWKSKADFEYGLTACYSVVYEWPQPLAEIIPCFDNLTDNSLCQHDEQTYGSTKTMAQGDITSFTGGFVNDVYKTAYKGIGRVHQVMSQLSQYKGSDLSADDRKFMLGQCKALRGYYYHWLYLCYKEVPLVTELLTTENMYMAKASRADLFAQITKDFDEAIAELPDLPYSDGKVSGRFTPAALKVLKARLMIFNAYNDSGIADPAKMKEVLPILESIKGYDLAGNLRDNFVSARQLASPEIIFSVRYLAPNRSNDIDLYFGAWATNIVMRNLVDEFECTDGQAWGVSPLTVKVDESLINSMDGSKKEAQKAEREKLYTNRDKRLAQSISHSGVLSFPEKDEFPAEVSGGGSPSGFSMMKLVQPSKNSPGYDTNTDPDVVIVRYADVLLMIAEAENEANGPTEKAYAAVNKVRARSEMPALPTGLTKDQMRERIRHEWRVETCFEGLHYFHMKQWKTLPKVNTMVDPMYGTKSVFKPEFYFWPLPQGEIDKANGVLVQDPAYK
ncbi:MAG: RagB/SusD family nutrient uptake outer membrane protein [Tannerellaceae bacterium]